MGEHTRLRAKSCGDTFVFVTTLVQVDRVIIFMKRPSSGVHNGAMRDVRVVPSH